MKEQMIPVELVFEEDKRRAEIPVKSSFKNLRGVVGKSFPKLKGLLVKYKDSDGDLMTITSSSELRHAESLVDNDTVLRLHVVEVHPEVEPDPDSQPQHPLLDLAQILLNDIRNDPSCHMKLLRVGVELCSEAHKENVTCEEKRILLDKSESICRELDNLASYLLGKKAPLSTKPGSRSWQQNQMAKLVFGRKSLFFPSALRQRGE